MAGRIVLPTGPLEFTIGGAPAGHIHIDAEQRLTFLPASGAAQTWDVAAAFDVNTAILSLVALNPPMQANGGEYSSMSGSLETGTGSLFTSSDGSGSATPWHCGFAAESLAALDSPALPVGPLRFFKGGDLVNQHGKLKIDNLSNLIMWNQAGASRFPGFPVSYNASTGSFPRTNFQNAAGQNITITITNVGTFASISGTFTSNTNGGGTLYVGTAESASDSVLDDTPRECSGSR
jgi:hypothetical protein